LTALGATLQITNMGIRDRDYMKNPSDEGGEGTSSTDSKIEVFFSGFLQTNPRVFLYVRIGLGALIVIGLVIAIISSRSH